MLAKMLAKMSYDEICAQIMFEGKNPIRANQVPTKIWLYKSTTYDLTEKSAIFSLSKKISKIYRVYTHTTR